ncbi:MAG: Zn-dependent protease, partial [Proteobacteria bacterium]|nr:Zn-dependent protease [Pseudomonadota bacterium]
INGIEAATGLARGKDWSFRVVLLRVGDTVYRLIFAAQGLTEAQDQRFLAAAGTFRRLSEEDAKAHGPMRLRLVTATGGQSTADLVAAQMANVPSALETFTLLNAVPPGEPLRAGASYKVVKP